MATHTIDLSGDVTLVLKIPSTHFAPLPKTPDAANPQTITGGSEAKPEVRIKVSGKHLSMASPMFERIISGNSKERVQTNGTPSVEIYVEGLDLEVFLILMNILHYKPQELPAQASVELVAKLGILADYYECVPVVRFYAVNWMTPTLMEMVPSTIGDTCMRDLMVRLWISWIFDLPEAFKYYSETLVQNSRGSIGLLGLPMPGRIINALNEHRNAAIEVAINFIDVYPKVVLTNDSWCTVACRSMTIGTLFIFREKHQILDAKAPYPGVILGELRSSIKSIKIPAWAEYPSDKSPPRKEHTCPLSPFDDLFAVLEDCAQGLDLSDFKP